VEAGERQLKEEAVQPLCYERLLVPLVAAGVAYRNCGAFASPVARVWRTGVLAPPTPR